MRKCPFCGAGANKLYAHHPDWDYSPTTIQIKCEGCGACGPTCRGIFRASISIPDQSKAFMYWHRRPK